MSPANLVGAKDIAARAGVKVDTVHKWRERHDSFPAPLAIVSDFVPVWDWLEVARWIEGRVSGKVLATPGPSSGPVRDS